MPSVKVERLTVGEMAVNCYIVENTQNQECVIVEPGADADRIIRSVGNRKPAAVLLTHGHFDHIGAVDAVCSHFQIPLYVHEGDAPKLNDPDANVSRLFGRPVVQNTQPVLLHGGEMLELAGMTLQVLHTPGHSAGGVCYVLPEGQGILTGDTLFANGYGRTDFADGDFGTLTRSLRMLMRLSPRQTSYPGHDTFGMVGRAETEEH